MTDPVGARWREVPAAVWSRRTWLSIVHLGSGALLWLVPAGVLMALMSLILTNSVRVRWPGLTGFDALGTVLTVAVTLLPVLLVLLASTSRFTAWQRARFRGLLGEVLTPFDRRPPDQGRLRWLARQAVAAPTWRQVRYHALCGLFNAVAGTLVVGGVASSAGLMVASILSGKGTTGDRIAVAVLAAAVVIGASWLARGAALLDLAMARALLQPPPAEALARRVESLSASRAGAVDAADAERRRIERDLHDGAQQRLVSLAMNLGMTRAAVRDADPEVRQAIAAAHDEAKQALAELRDFIRGLHPAVLDELGVDAALSGIAARSPVPVRLAVALRDRPPAAIEAVAYFVVSEALTNVARHAAATRAEVVLRQEPDGLFLSVTDDGHGGADPLRGTGLRGLQQRVESVDGTLSIASPTGGPTSIVVLLPCAS